MAADGTIYRSERLGAAYAVTAAGARNYADVERSLLEVARVMSARGLFAPYDFSAGRCLRPRDRARLADWRAEFRRRFPRRPATSWTCERSGTGSVASLLGDAGVEEAIAAGQRESGVRRYCGGGVSAIFTGATRDVIFETHLACVRKLS